MQVFFLLSGAFMFLITAPLEYTNTKNQLKFRFAEVDFLMNPPYYRGGPEKGYRGGPALQGGHGSTGVTRLSLLYRC